MKPERAFECPAPRLNPRERVARRKRASELRAMASLLSDDSPKVWAGLRQQFEARGKHALPTLNKAAKSRSARVRSRARTILLDLDRRAAIRRLVRYAARSDLDLERALFLLCRYHTPRLDFRRHQRALDAMAAEVAQRARRRTDELQRAQVLVEYLGGELAFGGSTGEFHHPDNIHLHRAIERRAGMPLTLCAVYMLVARRAGLRVAALPLPGHVMLRLYGYEKSVITDPYHHGQTRTERDCKRYLEQHNLVFQGDWSADATDRALFKRHIMNLLRSAQLRGLRREVHDLKLVVRVLEPRTERSRQPR